MSRDVRGRFQTPVRRYFRPPAADVDLDPYVASLPEAGPERGVVLNPCVVPELCVLPDLRNVPELCVVPNLNKVPEHDAVLTLSNVP